MSRIYADSQRVEDATKRILDAMKNIPIAVIPACAAICATPGIVFGLPGVFTGAIIGAMSGLRLSALIASALETKMITIVQLDELLCRQALDRQQAKSNNVP